MKWIKKGRIFQNNNHIEFSNTHAALPTPFLVDKETIRIYYATRDDDQKSRITYIDVEAKNPSKVIYTHDQPIFELGELGTFDDRGATPSGLFRIDNKMYFYYNGYNTATTVRYRIAVGIAEMNLTLNKGKKLSTGPVVDRNMFDSCGVATPFIIYDDKLKKYIIYYTSFTHWKIINNEQEPFYRIVRAESDDGMNWTNKHICIDYANDSDGGIVRPSVLFYKNRYHMWYSIRQSSGYRDQLDSSYRIKYAYSNDGINWIKKDSNLKVQPSLNSTDWDSEMVAYPYVLETSYGIYMFYNGNGFGQSGFGYAILDDE